MLTNQSRTCKNDNRSDDKQEQLEPYAFPLLHSTNVTPHYKYNKNYD